MTTIYHGTPMTPRSALLDVCKGRAMCVSFFRPDDMEAVEAISPAIMFRQRRVLDVASCPKARRGLGREVELVGLLRMVGSAFIRTRALVCNTGQPRRTLADQRCAAQRLAIRSARRSPLAHGQPYRTAFAPVRSIRPGVLGMDGQREVGRLSCLSRANGGRRRSVGKPLAGAAHDARHSGCLRLSVRKRGQHQPSAKRVAL